MFRATPLGAASYRDDPVSELERMMRCLDSIAESAMGRLPQWKRYCRSREASAVWAPRSLHVPSRHRCSPRVRYVTMTSRSATLHPRPTQWWDGNASNASTPDRAAAPSEPDRQSSNATPPNCAAPSETGENTKLPRVPTTDAECISELPTAPVVQPQPPPYVVPSSPVRPSSARSCGGTTTACIVSDKNYCKGSNWHSCIIGSPLSSVAPASARGILGIQHHSLTLLPREPKPTAVTPQALNKAAAPPRLAKNDDTKIKAACAPTGARKLPAKPTNRVRHYRRMKVAKPQTRAAERPTKTPPSRLVVHTPTVAVCMPQKPVNAQHSLHRPPPVPMLQLWRVEKPKRPIAPVDTDF